MQEFRIHGYGGQGTVTLAELVAFVGLTMGKRVQTLPFFGMERRGSPVRTALRLSDEEIFIRSQVYQPSIVATLSLKLIDSAIEEGIREDGALLVNSPDDAGTYAYEKDGAARSFPMMTIDATGLATEHGLLLTGQPLINIPMFGAIARLIGADASMLAPAIESKWSGSAAEKSIAVARAGFDAVKGLHLLGKRGE